MEYWCVVVYEIHRHLVASCSLHTGRTRIRHFEIVLLWVKTWSGCLVSLWHATVLGHPLLVLLLILLLFRGLIYQCRCLRLARRVLLLSLRPLFDSWSGNACHTWWGLVDRIKHLSLGRSRRLGVTWIKRFTHRLLEWVYMKYSCWGELCLAVKGFAWNCWDVVFGKMWLAELFLVWMCCDWLSSLRILFYLLYIKYYKHSLYNEF